MQSPQPGSVWKHNKGGMYRVINSAIDSTTLEPVVIYSELVTGRALVRPLDEFIDG